jgi:hypothetical protein
MPGTSLLTADGPLGAVLNTEAVSGEEFAAGLLFHVAVDRHPTLTDKVLGLPAGIGESSCLEGLRQRNVIAVERQRAHEKQVGIRK